MKIEESHLRNSYRPGTRKIGQTYKKKPPLAVKKILAVRKNFEIPEHLFYETPIGCQELPRFGASLVSGSFESTDVYE